MKKKMNFIDLITVLGPTASGKTKLAVKLAESLEGEIISADSRQVYKGMDIGTGKDISEYFINGKKIPYYLIDIIDPNQDYSVFQFQKDFQSIFLKLKKDKKIPILCGGSGLYLKAILMNYQLPQVPPDKELRKNLEKLSIDELIVKLEVISKNKIENNKLDTKRRIIRLIELQNSMIADKYLKTKSFIHNPLVVGINLPRELIKTNITNRLMQRFKEGMIEEVENLLNDGVSREKLYNFGLEYRFISQFLFGELNRDEMISRLNIAIHQFSKRQMTFYRNMEKHGIKIHWLNGSKSQDALMIINQYEYK